MDTSKMGKEKFVWDTSALTLVSPHEFNACSNFMWDHEDDLHIFPATLWFELRTGLSDKEGDGKGFGRFGWLDFVLPIDRDFLCKAVVLDLHPDFSSLSGTNFIFACAAIIEDATLVSQNKSVFQKLIGLNGLRVLFPENQELPPGYRI